MDCCSIPTYLMDNNYYKYIDSGKHFGRPICERLCFTHSNTPKDLYKCLDKCN